MARKLDALELFEVIFGYSGLTSPDQDLLLPLQKIHTLFYHLREKFPSLIEIGFSQNTLEPYSQSIESAEAALGAAGVTTTDSPRFETLRLPRASRKAYRKKVLRDQKHIPTETLQKIARAFDKLARSRQGS